MKASFAFFDINSSGKTRKLLDDNAAQTHMLVAHLIPDISVAIITPILLMVLIFFVDVRLGALLIFLTIIGLIQMKLMMGGQEFMKVYMQSLEKMNAEAVEYVRGMQVLKIFRTTVQSFRSFYDIIKQYSEYAYDYTMSCRKHFVSFQVIFKCDNRNFCALRHIFYESWRTYDGNTCKDHIFCLLLRGYI